MPQVGLPPFQREISGRLGAVRIETPKASSGGVGNGEGGYPLPSRLWGSGKRRKLLGWVRGGAPTANEILTL